MIGIGLVFIGVVVFATVWITLAVELEHKRQERYRREEEERKEEEEVISPAHRPVAAKAVTGHSKETMNHPYLDVIGGTITYPLDVYDMDFLAELTFEEAIAAVVAVAPQAVLGNGSTATEVQLSGEYFLFLNKLAVCIELTDGASIAIYHKDAKFHRIRAVRRSRR